MQSENNQSTDTFRFGIDSVLLADYAPVRKGDRVLDLGTGNGVIPLLLAKREPGLIHGESARLVDMAKEAWPNGLTDLITIIEGTSVPRPRPWSREATTWWSAIPPTWPPGESST